MLIIHKNYNEVSWVYRKTWDDEDDVIEWILMTPDWVMEWSIDFDYEHLIYLRIYYNDDFSYGFLVYKLLILFIVSGCMYSNAC